MKIGRQAAIDEFSKYCGEKLVAYTAAEDDDALEVLHGILLACFGTNGVDQLQSMIEKAAAEQKKDGEQNGQ